MWGIAEPPLMITCFGILAIICARICVWLDWDMRQSQVLHHLSPFLWTKFTFLVYLQSLNLLPH